MSVKRLTGKNKNDHAYIVGCPEFLVPKCANEILQSATDRLAAIEDILGDDYDLDRLLELMEADRNKRCVVLPTDDWTWTMRGDIARQLIVANCRAANTPMAPFEDDLSCMFCRSCRSGEYLYNEDGVRNEYCGQCGQRIDWPAVDALIDAMGRGEQEE